MDSSSGPSTTAVAAVPVTAKSTSTTAPTTTTSAAVAVATDVTVTKSIEDVIALASWPQSCPLMAEEHCISIVCGNTRLHWSLHSTSELFPTIFWKTTPVYITDIPKPKLIDYVPSAVKELIYGPDNDPGVTAAALASANAAGVGANAIAGRRVVANGPSLSKGGGTGPPGVVGAGGALLEYTPGRSATYRATFRIPGISVYVISTNETNLKGIALLFRNTIPSRVMLITSKDFNITAPESALTDSDNDNTNNNVPSTATLGYYEGIGVDRVCGIYGAKSIVKSNHLLVIDGGTAMTYTATDRTGKFYGGGIGAGLRMKFRSLFDYTSALPYITFDILMNYINEQKNKKKTQTTTSITGDENINTPTSKAKSTLFATNTQEAIITCILSETGLNLIEIVTKWYEETTTAAVGSSNGNDKNNSTNNKPTVVLTGGDCEIFQYLFDQHEEKIKALPITVVVNKHLLHHGLRAMLQQQMLVKQHTIKLEKQKLIEQSVASAGTESAVTAAKETATTVDATKAPSIPTGNLSLGEVRDILVGQRVAVISGLGEMTVMAIIAGSSEIPKRSSVTFGTVISVINNHPDRKTLDKDFYTIFWDNTGLIDDIPPRMLYDYLMLYTKANEAGKDRSADDNRRAKLEIKIREAKEAAGLLAQRSESVKGLIQARTQLVAPKKPPPPSAAVATTTSSASANPAAKRPRDELAAASHAAPGVATSSATTTAPGVSTSLDPTKKPKRTPTLVSLNELKDPAQDPKFYVRKRIAKDFDGEIYFGTVKKLVPAGENDEGVDLWLIEYDDGDAEDLERHELMDGFDLWYKHIASDFEYQRKLNSSK